MGGEGGEGKEGETEITSSIIWLHSLTAPKEGGKGRREGRKEKGRKRNFLFPLFLLSLSPGRSARREGGGGGGEKEKGEEGGRRFPFPLPLPWGSGETRRKRRRKRGSALLSCFVCASLGNGEERRGGKRGGLDRFFVPHVLD